MTAPTPHRPTCQCGGTGLIQGPPLTSTNDRTPNPRTYQQLTECPGQPWPTQPPTRTQAAHIARTGLTNARKQLAAADNPTKDAS